MIRLQKVLSGDAKCHTLAHAPTETKIGSVIGWRVESFHASRMVERAVELKSTRKIKAGADEPLMLGRRTFVGCWCIVPRQRMELNAQEAISRSSAATCELHRNSRKLPIRTFRLEGYWR